MNPPFFFFLVTPTPTLGMILLKIFSWNFSDVPLVKNLPAMQETQVQFLGRKDPLEKEMATQLQYSCLENPRDRGV